MRYKKDNDEQIADITFGRLIDAIKSKDAVQDIELNLEENTSSDIVPESETMEEENIFDNFDENSLFDDFE